MDFAINIEELQSNRSPLLLYLTLDGRLFLALSRLYRISAHFYCACASVISEMPGLVVVLA